MITALDTNIISELFLGGHHAEDVRKNLELCRRQGSLSVSAVVYVELMGFPNATASALHEFLQDSGIQIDKAFNLLDWTMVGSRYSQYAERRRKATREQPRRLLADFVIGAHALASANRLMTLDTAFYRRVYPELRLYPEPPA